ncbi:hypothetical protein GGS23DRAFT_589721 [Durotheca rogersii]|uniref:uncharacterized protein n=1 Tax=Durotheca rogersii TaxID=419775 RepID=UPI00221F23D7|nr:uncharacterized protein GGS23DRAFT_589721 [Durotheca rogersii]KAI5855566.1 hypothetical protein GGS23DRAFT_589721 [Durotheca rogersii]
MRPSTALTSLAFVASAFAQGVSPPQMPGVSSLSSRDPFQCSPGKSLSISIDAGKLTTTLPELQFQATSHGRTDTYAGCQFRVELNDWYYRYRVAISGATVRGRANLTDGAQIYQFNTTATFRLQHLKNLSPITPPEVTNLSLSTMLTQLTPAKIGGDGSFTDDFDVPVASPAQLVWSPCFHGTEGSSQDFTYIDFEVSATSSDGTGEGTSRLDSGLTVDWDLAWQECVPDWGETYSWGEQRVEDWQTCTYRSENNQTFQR